MWFLRSSLEKLLNKMCVRGAFLPPTAAESGLCNVILSFLGAAGKAETQERAPQQWSFEFHMAC